VTQFAAALFFIVALLASMAILQMTVRDHWHAIIAALRGEIPDPVRSKAQVHPRLRVRSRTVVVRARPAPSMRAAA
jgi:hypothetical protein